MSDNAQFWSPIGGEATLTKLVIKDSAGTTIVTIDGDAGTPVDIKGSTKAVNATNAQTITIDPAATGPALIANGVQIQFHEDGAIRLYTDEFTVLAANGLSTLLTLGASGLTVAGTFGWDSSSLLSASADGKILLQNNAKTGFTSLQFGGITSSFPCIQRSSGALMFRLADESAYAPVYASAYNVGGVGYLSGSGSGVVHLVDVAGTGFDRLCLGGGTSSFPALRRSGSVIQCYLADGTNFTTFECGILTSRGAFKLGCPDTAAADGSLTAGQLTAWVNESTNKLTFKVKYANGTTIKSGEVSLA